MILKILLVKENKLFEHFLVKQDNPNAIDLQTSRTDDYYQYNSLK